jgi:molybdate transport system ATP-binding protein
MSWDLTLRDQIGDLELDVTLQGDDRPTAIIGPNGAGKTTLLRLIAGNQAAREGRIEVAGTQLFDSATRLDLPPEARGVGYVPQGYGLFPHLTVSDNVAFGLAAAGVDVAQRVSRTQEALEHLECAHLSGRYPARLSGGEQQRVALARALVVAPRLLLLDEPLAALDAISRRKMRALLATHLQERRARGGGFTLLVTHDLLDVIALEANVAVMEAGKLVQQGPVEEVRQAPASDFVAEFFNLV